MRLIDADAAVKRLREVYCNDCDRRKGMKNGKQQFCYEIGDAPCRACGIEDAIEWFEEADEIDAIPVEWLMDKAKETEAQAEPHFAFMYVLHEWQETKSIEEQQAESEMRDLKAELKELLSEQEEHGI